MAGGVSSVRHGRAPSRRSPIGRGAVLGACLLAVSGCGPERATPAAPGARGATSSVPVPATPIVPAPTTPASGQGGYTLHEWGLLGAAAGSTELAAASAPHTRVPAGLEDGPFGTALPTGLGMQGTGLGGGKPVVYAHLDPGVESARFSLSMELSTGRFDERFPGAHEVGRALRFDDVSVSRGACAMPAAPPSADDAACRTPDGFCEAVELRRYHGDDDTCLRVGGLESPLLFYRASALSAEVLPLGLLRSPADQLDFVHGALVEGVEVVYLLVHGDLGVDIRRLTRADLRGPVDPSAGTALTPDALRDELVEEATSRGLTPREADAFIDAWSVALGSMPRRSGEVASGPAPAGLGAARTAILYFAPRATIDAALPLEVDPAPRALHRVFLVRVVEPAAPRPAMAGEFGSVGTLGGLSHPPNGAPLVAGVVRFVGAPRVVGGLDPDTVRRVLQRNVNQVQHCDGQARGRNPNLTGTVRIGFVIGGNGAVVMSRSIGGSLSDRTMTACVAGAVHRWAFPMPTTASVQVEVEWSFRPAVP